MTTRSKSLSELMVGGGESDRSRLRLLSISSDSHTKEIINSLSLPDDANCLELAAGVGSVTVWLAARFSAGNVHAVDIDLSPLPAILPSNVTTELHDIGSEDFQLKDRRSSKKGQSLRRT
jgi:16S rRNA A1518/A1519 N6-dimethyltransferase RsmA/KsgA/DIM1 with predicted DNA glycosylase/AP lyase activity